MQETAQAAESAADRSAETILVVEDSMVEQQRMLAMLQGFGYRVIAADDGQQAMQILRERSVALVLTDWQMPRMTGIDLCRAVRADPASGQPYVILVTGRNTHCDLVAGMDAGADDFISKPFNGEELRVRVQAGMRLLTLRRDAEQRSLELAAALEREAEANQVIRHDLTVAARMQQETLPTGPSPFANLQVGTLFRAATEVAGDGYDFFRLDDKHLAFYVIDVAGHGVASAMLSFTVSRFLSPATGAIALRSEGADAASSVQRALPGHIVPPDRVVDALNRRFAEKADCKHYFTMVYGVLDVESGLGELCQAGHPHPLIVASKRRVTRLGAGGFPVGMLEEANYESTAFRLGRGERLVVYSDGITDCRGSDGRRFGEQGLTNLLASLHGQRLPDAIDRIDGRLRQWQGDAAAEDDMSLLVIERLAADGPAGVDSDG